MHDHRPILAHRVERTLRERVRPADSTVICPLTVTAYEVTDPGYATGQGEPVSRKEAMNADYQPFTVGTPWGPPWGTTWFHVTADVPADKRDVDLELVIDLGWEDHSPGFQAEGLVLTPEGDVVKAVNPRNQWVPVPAGAEKVDFYIEAAANPLLLGVPPFIPTQDGDKETASSEPLYRLVRADLVEVNHEARQLAYDLEVARELAEHLPEDDPRGWKLLLACQDALDALDLADVAGTADRAREALAPALSVPARPEAQQITAVAHAHIDSAWLWPLRETRRKVVRTIANVLRLLDDGRTMYFALPAAQHLAWLKEDDPVLFDRAVAAMKNGLAGKPGIVPVGGMWVEPDAVLPGSEAMVRQFVEGQKFFREHTGEICPEMWLPDSFGYSGALPQLAKLAGAKWFLTQKISWNQVNRFPHHTLNWEGIDGTRIFTHFPPVDTYGAEVSSTQVRHAETNFQDMGRANVSLMPYGYGDGGGGPTRDMLERIDRFANLSGAAKLVHERPADFFTRAEEDYPHPGVWAGELYLELHRGTFTSQADTKLGNRRNEHLLREAELWSAYAATVAGFDYPYEELEECWHTVLLGQFHDILPGTSIAWVHHEVVANHAKVTETLEDIIARATRALVGEGEQRITLNSGPFDRPAGSDQVPALGGAAGPEQATDKSDGTASEATDSGERVLDNGILRATVTSEGTVSSLVHVASGREVVPAGEHLGSLVLHEDFPNMWDAWDVDPFYRASAREVTGGRITGQDATSIQVSYDFGESNATVTFSLPAGARSLGIDLDIDWHETEKFLKLRLPVDIHALDAAFETQFGHVRRTIHENTSWEAARFEVSTHRWVHVGEPGFGVALANSATYGLDVAREARAGGGTYTIIRPSILRAPRFPDPATDQGHHHRSFLLTPGADIPTAVETGYEANLPLRTVRGDHAPQRLLEVSGAVVEAVKLAEDRSGDLIVRLYEPHGARAEVELRTERVYEASTCSLLEGDLEGYELPEIVSEDNSHRLSLRPFQVATVRLKELQ